MNLKSVGELIANRSCATALNHSKEILVVSAISSLVILELFSIGVISFADVYGAHKD